MVEGRGLRAAGSGFRGLGFELGFGASGFGLRI